MHYLKALVVRVLLIWTSYYNLNYEKFAEYITKQKQKHSFWKFFRHFSFQFRFCCITMGIVIYVQS